MRFEGFQQLLALGQDVAEELLMVAELAFQFLQLHQQARQLLVRSARVLAWARALVMPWPNSLNWAPNWATVSLEPSPLRRCSARALAWFRRA